MHALALLVVQSLVQGPQAPVLQFPEAGLDDPVAYEGYATRFFRDSRRNAFQIYLDTRAGRVVHVWADATNASAALTVRDTSGVPAPLTWGGPGAETLEHETTRVMRHHLQSDRGALEVGWFLLGTMRQERDFQYWGWHRRPYGDGPFALSELTELIASLERLPPAERGRHLALVGAPDVATLRARLRPRFTHTENDTAWAVTVEQLSLDGRNRMTLMLSGDRAATTARLAGDVVRIEARRPGGVRFAVTATTDAAALTPLSRDQIFNDAFEAYFARQRRLADSVRGRLTSAAQAMDPAVLSFRRLEREIRGLELLSYEEKLIAALPNYATYFGRDMMMTALMLEPISSVELQEHVIASVLRKLSPTGEASHEEALGGQAIRENAAEYSARIREWSEARATDPAAAAASLAQARAVLENLQAVRENYRMIDDDFQLPVLAARYLARADVSGERKRRFLAESSGGGVTRLEAIVRNLAFVARLAHPYAVRPEPVHLVGFQYRDERGWLPGSWRDSRAGYGGGRFAMDVNVVWVPKALEAAQVILAEVDALGLSATEAVARVPGDAAALAAVMRDPAHWRSALLTWRGARRHFEVALTPADVGARVETALGAMGDPEGAYWRRQFAEQRGELAPLAFLAVSLDSLGQPIPVATTDPATDLYLGDHTVQVLGGAIEPEAVLTMLDALQRRYPVGLFVAGLGPLVANDVYASPAVQQAFRDDLYHSPRVVWGREVNLLFLGLARQIEAAYDASGRLRDDRAAVRQYVSALRHALESTRAAVEASGLRHNELWSYRIDAGTLRPVRYGTSSDIQLWNVTDLAVRFLLDRLPAQ
ncbi:MAG: hypothetical protein OEY20_05145 [Gemmatimonadota bacterium]|nr:hypothetical protein [Gemmatimonadota bacterium]MDH4349720.1 hypothetical protein [Gemmatimonadota bacterium]MDH5196615.1 hypothetical protein [Gemmatimonadota bacterium]